MRSSSRFLSTGHPSADAVERGLALVLAGAIACGVWVIVSPGNSLHWAGLVKGIACATLVAALVCIWITNSFEDVPARSFDGTWARWVAHLQDLLNPGNRTLHRLERSKTSRAAIMLAVEAMAGMDADLFREIGRGRTGVETAAETAMRVSDRTLAVAGAARAATAELAAMQTNAADLATAAYAAQASMHGLSTIMAPLADTADQLHQELGRLMVQTGALCASAPEFAALAQTVRTGAVSTMAMLDTLLAAVAKLTSGSVGAFTHVEQMIALVLAQHRAGELLADRIHVQSVEVTALIREIETLQPNLLAAGESAERASLMETSRQKAAHAVWQDLAEVPGRAATVALLLKGLPGASASAQKKAATSPQTLG